MRTRRVVAAAFFGLLVLLAQALSFTAASDTAFQTGLHRWRGVDGAFAGWTFTDAQLVSGQLQIAPTAPSVTDPYTAGSYNGHNFYNGGSYNVGEATSPEMAASFSFSEAIASGNAETPAGTWIETLLRVRIGARWTKWYSMGVWTSNNAGNVLRHSVASQGDADGYVSTDTLVLGKKIVADGYQAKVRVFTEANGMTPVVRNISVAVSSPAPKKASTSAGDATAWNKLVDVPQCSQMVYPDGGNVWCSPTSTSMVLGFWGTDPGDCGPRVRAAVEGTYDFVYKGNGNWPFNTAYAASRGFEAYAARFTSLADVEPWIKAGVPVVFSFAWGKKDLTGAAVPSSDGHLAVIVGFDETGNPIVNDPAAATNDAVRRTYLRSELEPLWLTSSGGLVYLIYRPGTTVPPLQ